MPRALVTIGTYDVPDPSTYESTTATIVDSARNVQGIVVGAVIREDVAKVAMSWRFLTVPQWASILSQFSSRLGGHFYNQVTFFCHDTGLWETRTMYVSDRTSGAYQRGEDGNIRGYTDPSLSLVEV